MKKLIFLFVLIPTILFSQHHINGAFSPAENFTYAFLYKATPSGADYVDQAKLQDDGTFSLVLPPETPAGVYKIVYALPPEENNFNLIYNGKEDVAFQYDLNTGLKFTASKDNLLWESYTEKMETINAKISAFYENNVNDTSVFNGIFNELKDTQAAYEAQAAGTLVLPFIKGNATYVPSKYEDTATYTKHLKETYFDHIDFSNSLLQSSDFLVDRVVAYVFAMSSSSNKDYKQAIDDVEKAIGNNLIIKTALLEVLWQRMVTIENPEVANYIGDEYLFKLAKKTNNEYLSEAILSYRNTAIGSKAKNFDLAIQKNGETIETTLMDLDISDTYLLIFWSSTCGHCLNELPKVRDFLKSRPDVKVIAFGLEEDAENWKNEIVNFPDFIHVLGLEKWDNPLVKTYGLRATPSYFVLDKDKTILAKPEHAEDLETYFQD